MYQNQLRETVKEKAKWRFSVEDLRRSIGDIDSFANGAPDYQPNLKDNCDLLIEKRLILNAITVAKTTNTIQLANGIVGSPIGCGSFR